MWYRWMLCSILFTSVYGQLRWVRNMENFRLREELPPDTHVYTLLAEDSVTGSSSGIVYGFNNLQGNDIKLEETSSIFRVNRTTGEVFTYGHTLDYDKESDLKTEFTQHFLAKKADDSQFTRHTSRISLVNINDNAPAFSGTASVSVNESVTIQSGGVLLFSNITATDPDSIVSTPSTVIEMSIRGCRYTRSNISDTDCRGSFRIQQTGFSTKKYEGEIYLMKQLDFEDESVINILLLATDGEMSSEFYVVVTVVNQQDLPPQWTVLPFNTKTDEHDISFQVLVEAVDGDGLNRPVYYSFVPGQTTEGIAVDDVFQIDHFTGVVTNKVELDLEDETYFRNYETGVIRREWRITLQACEIESANPLVLTNQCAPHESITITINDINDNAPLHVRTNVYEYRLFENEPNERALDSPSIEIFDRDTEIYNKFRTELIQPSAEFYITEAERNPVIRIKNTTLIDMDTPPRDYTLLLRTYDIDDPTLSSTATVRIFLMDRNDNKPYFTVPGYSATVAESAQEGDLITTVRAYDRDYDVDYHGNRSIQYSLLGAYSDLFLIHPENGVVTVKRCPSNANGRHGVHPCIDYDIEPRVYNLDVQATDNKSSNFAEFSTIPLTIQVLRENDNRPEVGNYTREIREGLTKFNPPLIIEGFDRDDVGGSSSLSYSIQAQSPGSFWTVDRISGEIMVSKPDGSGIRFTDGDIDGQFELQVKVTDGLYDTTSYVYIRVLDENDNAPYFREDEFVFSISETTPGDESIYKIQAFDDDDPTTDNGKLEYSIFSGNVGGKFRLDPISGEIFTTPSATFDYEVQRVYRLLAVVNDKGTPQLQGVCNITINIINENNKNPMILPFLQPFQVMENAPLNHIFGRITGGDPDADAVVRFEFIEPMRAYSKDGNEIERDSYDFTTIFALDRESAELRVNTTNLDSDLTRDLTFNVRILDITPEPDQVGYGTITIEVLPFNSVPPVFQAFDSPIRLPEEQPPGSVIITLIARDDDGIQLYEIIQQPDNYFMITRNTGSVNIRTKVDYDDLRQTNDSYFIVQVKDTGRPQLSATASVSVIFYNINDEYPYFVNTETLDPQDIYYGYIDENSPDGTPVTIVKALDNDRPDANGFHEVRYFMDDDRFEVDNITGAVTVRLQPGIELDREQNSKTFALVRARDNPNDPDNQNQAAATIQVELRDVNDNPPIFSDDEYVVTIYETINRFTDILQVFTTDLDVGPHAVSLYSKIPNRGNDIQGLFAVRRESGRIFVNESLLGKARRLPYEFWVQAQDNVGTGFVSEVKVSVFVKESANSPPEWVIPPRANMTINVLESQYPGFLIYDVKAVDNDSGDNGIVDYSFIYEGQTTQVTPEFEISRVTGVIHSPIVFDRETTDRYVLLLKATDRGQTPLEATRFLTIVIKDVNDNPPIFPTNEYTGEILTLEYRVPENAEEGHYIGNVQATDADLNPVIIYEFIGGNEDEVFALSRYGGDITLAKKLDTEYKSVYYLDIRARNEEPDYTVIRSRKRRAVDPSIITVKILVGDINDLAPVFLENEYYGCVSTRSPYDKHIMTVTAKDYDAVGSGIVRYMVVDGNVENGQTLFDVHPKFGVISNKVLMRDYANRVFTLKVNARDGESIEDSESANVTARVFVTLPGKEVKLLITQNTGEVRLYQSQIQSIIEEAKDLDYLCINEIEDHVTKTSGAADTLWSDVYVSGVRRNSNGELVIISGIELRNIISREMDNREQDFELLYIREVELASSSDEVRLEDKAVLIILIIIAVLIFLVIIFCIVAFMCIRAAKQQKKQILVHKTHATPAPVMVVEPEPIPIVYDNRQFVEEVPVKEPEPEPEPVVVSTFQEERVYQPEPVHVQYAVVDKGIRPPQDEDDQDAIVVELKDDEPRQQDVYEPEYRIVAEVEEK